MQGQIYNAFSLICFVGAGPGLVILYVQIRDRMEMGTSMFSVKLVIGITAFVNLSGIILHLLGLQHWATNTVNLLISASTFIIMYLVYIKGSIKIPFNVICRNIDDPVLILDKKQLVYFNESASRAFSIRKRNLGTSIELFFPELNGFTEENSFRLNVKSNLYSVSKIIINTKKEKAPAFYLFTDITALSALEHALEQKEQEFSSKLEEQTEDLQNINNILLQEIDEHKSTVEKLKISLEEKSVLLNEVHHRVKNNLQVVTSFLNLQKRTLKDKKTIEVFNTAVSRIGAMASIHQKLYKTDRFSDSMFSEYVTDLVQTLIRTYRNNQEPIHQKIEIENIYLDIEASINCGLILNELITNCLKYAFPEPSGEDMITVRFTSQKSDTVSEFGNDFSFELSVQDNGIGFPEEQDESKKVSLGYKIIKALVKTLHGKMTKENAGGTLVRIVF